MRSSQWVNRSVVLGMETMGVVEPVSKGLGGACECKVVIEGSGAYG